MKVLLVGEADSHRHQLQAALEAPVDIVGLPEAAAYEGRYDDAISPDDVVVALRFRRPDGPAPAFRLLHVPGAGLDGIDRAAIPDSVRICNVFEHEVPIAEYVTLCLLEHAIGASAMRRSFTSASWPTLYRNRIPHGEVSGSTVGVIGYGRIGREVAKRARSLGARVIAVDSQVVDDDTAEVRGLDSLGSLLEESDCVVVCCPLTDGTRGLIDQAALRRMKNSAALINPSRAEIVDEGALYYALREGVIASAFLDVWYRYPAGDDAVAPSRYRFLELPNAFCTPHSAAWTRQLPERRYRFIAANIDRLRRGEPLLNEIKWKDGSL